MVREKKARTPEILSGWKNIARHLGMGVRTVQRYERQRGLPIRRPAGKMRGAVLATKSELDAWVAASAIRDTFLLANSDSATPSTDLKALKAKVEEMRALREQMVALRDEVRNSMWFLSNSIETLRKDLRSNAWDVSSTLVSDPQTRRLLEGLPIEKRGGTIKQKFPLPSQTTLPCASHIQTPCLGKVNPSPAMRRPSPPWMNFCRKGESSITLA